MLLATTHQIDMEGVDIFAYLGVATGISVKGINAVRDLMSNVTDFIGGKSGGYNKAVEAAQHDALEALQVKAAEMGGNAVIGVSIDFEFIPGKSGMLMATAAGTVVQISVQGQP
ncbi:heavy metal-binding domain-containing protein [Thiolapillus sp.]|uniref:heavy metal-binding domain-containing protein n=3 Tax=Thiolapillus sp. TaxID=2017437 RepID=UPI0025EF2A27|nr:heavy metal-binding domain-containing protein [Thiolapillus sp.]